MYIKNIHIKNYKGIKELTLELEPGVTLVIGNNGAGKTSMLSALNVVLEGMFALSNGILRKSSSQMKLSSQIMTQNDIHTTSVTAGDVTESMKYHVPVVIGYNVDIDGKTYSQECRIEHEGNGTNFTTYNLSDKMQELLNQSDSALPLLNYQSIDRANLSSDIREAQLKGQFERRQGYVNSFIGKSSIEDVQDWCLSMAFEEFQSRRTIKEYETFRKIVSRFIQKIEGMKTEPKIELSPKLRRLVYSDNQEGQLINNLSAGYQSVLCMIMELAYRTVLLNPNIDGSEDVEGVVLIDEIDMHLHPKWQWKILDALKATFPKVQFIVATHSPIVISSAENARILRMLSPDKVEQLPNVYGYNTGDVLELTQDSLDMPEEVKRWRKEIEQALDDDNLPRAEAIVNTAENELRDHPTVAKRIREFFEINKWIAED